MTTDKTLLIYNPIAGSNKQTSFLSAYNTFRGDKSAFELIATEYAGHAKIIAKESVGKYKAIVAIGGDGTVNEVASSLVNTNTSMGIIPMGSGNGLARHLKIPLNIHQALEALSSKQSQAIDVLKIGNKYSVNVSGVGFDGHIAALFSQSSSRGVLSYIKLSIHEYFKYQEFNFELNIPNQKIEGKAFIIALANASQFGNNVEIAKNANVQDGKVNIIVIKRPPLYRLPELFYDLQRGNTTQNSYCKEYIVAKASLSASSQNYHLDGEPELLIKNKQEVSIEVLENALQIIY